MGRWVLPLLMAVAVAGCTTVKFAQKDGCWVRRSEKWLGDAKEELGPCKPPEPKWSEDRLTRLIQECVVRADYRWQARALDAWDHGQKLPERANDETVVQQCIGEPTRAVLAENESLRGQNDALQKRIADLSSDRDQVRKSEEDARKRLVGSYEKMTEKMSDYLGAAANKAQAPAKATATASSDSKGAAHTESAHDARTSVAARTSPGQPAVVVATAPEGEVVRAPATRARAPATRVRAATAPALPVCPPAPEPQAQPQHVESVWSPNILEPSVAEQPAPAAQRAPGAAQ
jgi:hypothetical protein